MKSSATQILRGEFQGKQPISYCSAFVPARSQRKGCSREPGIRSIGSDRFRSRRLSFLVLVFLVVFASASAHAGDWGPWTPFSDHPGVSFRVRCYSCDIQSSGPYTWLAEFKNDYNTTVAFSFRITPAGESPGSVFTDRVEIPSGATRNGTSGGLPPSLALRCGPRTGKFP